MQVAVVPVGALRHVLRDVVNIGVGHAGGDVQHHVVGIALGADMDAVDMQVERRRRQLLGIARHRVAQLDVSRVEQILDGQSGEGIAEMHDQPLAGSTLRVGAG